MTFEQIVNHIHNHLDEPLSLEDLARLANMSPRHFSRQFKQHTGYTPHQYVVQYRVETAKQLLIRTNISIVEIATIVGFCSQSHLNRHFKKILGVTPKDLRLAKKKDTKKQKASTGDSLLHGIWVFLLEIFPNKERPAQGSLQSNISNFFSLPNWSWQELALYGLVLGLARQSFFPRRKIEHQATVAASKVSQEAPVSLMELVAKPETSLSSQMLKWGDEAIAWEIPSLSTPAAERSTLSLLLEYQRGDRTSLSDRASDDAPNFGEDYDREFTSTDKIGKENAAIAFSSDAKHTTGYTLENSPSKGYRGAIGSGIQPLNPRNQSTELDGNPGDSTQKFLASIGADRSFTEPLRISIGDRDFLTGSPIGIGTLSQTTSNIGQLPQVQNEGLVSSTEFNNRDFLTGESSNASEFASSIGELGQLSELNALSRTQDAPLKPNAVDRSGVANSDKFILNEHVDVQVTASSFTLNVDTPSREIYPSASARGFANHAPQTLGDLEALEHSPFDSASPIAALHQPDPFS